MLAERYLFFRKSVLRMSQVEFSERLGTKQGTIANWEKRGNEPSGKLLWAMIKEFRLNPDWLFDGIGEPQAETPSVKNKNTTVVSDPSIKIDFGTIEMPVGVLATNQAAIARLSQSISELRAAIERSAAM